MRRTSLLVVIGGIGLGLVAEGVAFDLAEPHLWIPDLLVGWVFIGCGLVVASRRPEGRCGTLMEATGFTWFLGNFAGAGMELVAWVSAHGIYVYRGPLVHLLLAYPGGRRSSRPARAAVGVGYAAALVTPVWASEGATILLSAALVAICAHEFRRAVGRHRRERLLALWAAAGLGLVLGGGALAHLTLPSGQVSPPSLLAYQAMLCAIAVGLVVGIVASSWEGAQITDLVVELGTARSRTLRAALSRALGDPSLEVGYWYAEAGAYVDSRGREVALPDPASKRSVTFVEHDDEPVAVIIHDPAVLDDPGLLTALTSATRLAAANARLQAEVRARVAELEASRRRILDARDAEHRRLERRLHEGAQRRLEEVAEALRRGRLSASSAQTSGRIVHAEGQVAQSMEELRRLARGLHPRVLSEHGLERALASVVERFPVPVEVEVEVPADRMPPSVEAAAYYVCAEALANVVKYSSASKVSVSVIADDARVVVVVEDDGVGGADPARGSGLRGLSDRVATLRGTIRVESAAVCGTRLTAEIPLGGENL